MATLEIQGQGLENFCSQQKLNSTLRMHLSKSSVSDGNTQAECGAGRVRTDDIQLAKLALSQLSYSPGTSVLRKEGTGWRRPLARRQGGASGGPRWT